MICVKLEISVMGITWFYTSSFFSKEELIIPIQNPSLKTEECGHWWSVLKCLVCVCPSSSSSRSSRTAIWPYGTPACDTSLRRALLAALHSSLVMQHNIKSITQLLQSKYNTIWDQAENSTSGHKLKRKTTVLLYLLGEFWVPASWDKSYLVIKVILW